MYTIYVITNINNKKRYIGMTSKSVEDRFKGHLRTAKSKKTKSSLLHEDIKLYGESLFDYDVIEFTDDSTREEYWIHQLKTYDIEKGYNVCRGGFGHPKIPQKTIDMIIQLYQSGGKSIREISKEVGVCEEQISIHLKENDIPILSCYERNRKNHEVKVCLKSVNGNTEKFFNSQYLAALWLIENNHTTTKNYKRVQTNINLVLKGTYKTIYGFSITKW